MSNELANEIVLTERNCGGDRSLTIDGHAIPGVVIKGGRQGYEPLLFSYTNKEGRRLYIVCNIKEENEWDWQSNIIQDTPGVLISRFPREWGDVLPEWAGPKEKFAGIPRDYFENLSTDEREKLFWSEKDWDDAFEDEDEYNYGDDEEDTPEDKAERKKDFIDRWEYEIQKNLDSVIYLDVYSHSGDSWSVHGCGMQCQWDTTSCAAALYLNEYLTKKLDTDHEEVMREINWFLKRLSGRSCCELFAECIIDAETYELVELEDEGIDVQYARMHTLDWDIDSPEGLKDIVTTLQDCFLGDVADLHFVKAETAQFKNIYQLEI